MSIILSLVSFILMYFNIKFKIMKKIYSLFITLTMIFGLTTLQAQDKDNHGKSVLEPMPLMLKQTLTHLLRSFLILMGTGMCQSLLFLCFLSQSM